MRLSETRFVKIDGTDVSAAVDSAEQAKAAVAELRHKKREYTHIRRALVKARRQAEAAAARARRPRRAKDGAMASLRALVGGIVNAAGALKRANAQQDLQLIEREMKKADDILHNIDTVLLQIQGKLLHRT